MNDLFSTDAQGQPVDQPISGFFGPFRFLSNFWSASVILDGVTYPSTENAYQAAKTHKHLRSAFVHCTASQAKQLGRGVSIRDEWNTVKVDVMCDLIRQKFAPGTALASQLINTKDSLLVEANTWGDTFWGQCDGNGRNHLGRLLMIQRDYLRAPILAQSQKP